MTVQQVKSKKRVADHGEVFTSEREVNAMLDLVKDETEKLESTFLEPACGTGNFLAEILRRKLAVVKRRYKGNQLDFERNSTIAIASVYGVDILQDNIVECRARLFDIFNEMYIKTYKKKSRDSVRKAVKFILDKNIVWGDALSLETVGDNSQTIVFSQWSAINGSKIKRKDFCYKSMIDQASLSELPLFSDLGEEAYIPTPIKDYPPVHFLEIINA
jgi:SAM-dependent methyltransferase